MFLSPIETWQKTSGPDDKNRNWHTKIWQVFKILFDATIVRTDTKWNVAQVWYITQTKYDTVSYWGRARAPLNNTVCTVKYTHKIVGMKRCKWNHVTITGRHNYSAGSCTLMKNIWFPSVFLDLFIFDGKQRNCTVRLNSDNGFPRTKYTWKTTVSLLSLLRHGALCWYVSYKIHTRAVLYRKAPLFQNIHTFDIKQRNIRG